MPKKTITYFDLLGTSVMSTDYQEVLNKSKAFSGRNGYTQQIDRVECVKVKNIDGYSKYDTDEYDIIALDGVDNGAEIGVQELKREPHTAITTYTEPARVDVKRITQDVDRPYKDSKEALQPYHDQIKNGYTIIEVCDHAVRVLWNEGYFTSITTSTCKNDNKYCVNFIYVSMDKEEAQRYADKLQTENPVHKVQVARILDIYPPRNITRLCCVVGVQPHLTLKQTQNEK